MLAKLRRNLRDCERLRRDRGWRAAVRHGARLLTRPYLRARIRFIGPERPLPVPHLVQLEPTSRCNLRCPSCPHASATDPGQDLTPDLLRRQLDRLPFRPAEVVLAGIGEPLLNTALPELLEILAARGSECTLFTNGTLLTSTMRDALLPRRGLAAVAISCDGANAETFESLRRGADFERWREFVRSFLRGAAERRPRPLPCRMHTVLNDRNVGEAPAIVRLAAELGFQGVHFLQPVPAHDGVLGGPPRVVDWGSHNRQSLTDLGRGLGVRVTFDLCRSVLPPRGSLRCFQPWEYISVRADGGVYACCAVYDADRRPLMGNLLEQDFASIWYGDAFREFRRTSAAGTNAFCRTCPYY